MTRAVFLLKVIALCTLLAATFERARDRRRARDAEVLGDFWFPDDGLARFL